MVFYRLFLADAVHLNNIGVTHEQHKTQRQGTRGVGGYRQGNPQLPAKRTS